MNSPNQVEAEVLRLVRERGLADKLAEEEQLDREAQRAKLFDEIDQMRRDQAGAIKKIGVERNKAEQELLDARGRLLKAEEGMRKVEAAEREASHADFLIQRRENLIATLADRRIDRTRIALIELLGTIGRHFSAVNATDGKNFDGVPIRRTYSNADELDAIAASIRGMVNECDRLTMQRDRPADLGVRLDRMLGEAHNAVAAAGTRAA